MNLKTIIFIGRSGSGKGTQSKKLVEFFKEKDQERFFHLEAGERFRNFIVGDSYSSLLARKISEKGELQPEFLSIWAWTGSLLDNLEKHDHLLIDGTPRRLIEAKILESVFDFYDRTEIDVVYLKVSTEESKKRLKERKRADDIEEESIDNRMSWFDEEVSLVLDYYRSHKSHKFHEIDGEGSVDEVYLSIIKSIGLEDYLDD